MNNQCTPPLPVPVSLAWSPPTSSWIALVQEQLASLIRSIQQFRFATLPSPAQYASQVYDVHSLSTNHRSISKETNFLHCTFVWTPNLCCTWGSALWSKMYLYTSSVMDLATTFLLIALSLDLRPHCNGDSFLLWHNSLTIVLKSYHLDNNRMWYRMLNTDPALASFTLSSLPFCRGQYWQGMAHLLGL